jgi:hypothetical protein
VSQKVLSCSSFSLADFHINSDVAIQQTRVGK